MIRDNILVDNDEELIGKHVYNFVRNGKWLIYCRGCAFVGGVTQCCCCLPCGYSISIHNICGEDKLNSHLIKGNASFGMFNCDVYAEISVDLDVLQKLDLIYDYLST